MSVLNKGEMRRCQVKKDHKMQGHEISKNLPRKKTHQKMRLFMPFWHSPHRTGRNIMVTYDLPEGQSTS
jgi:hypothetical protein